MSVLSFSQIFCLFTKGQIKPKADWPAIDSPKQQMNEFVLFDFLLFMANKTNSFVLFLGESTARQNCFRFYLTFISQAEYRVSETEKQ
jgi:hypothetical protein